MILDLDQYAAQQPNLLQALAAKAKADPSFMAQITIAVSDGHIVVRSKENDRASYGATFPIGMIDDSTQPRILSIIQRHISR